MKQYGFCSEDKDVQKSQRVFANVPWFLEYYLSKFRNFRTADYIFRVLRLDKQSRSLGGRASVSRPWDRKVDFRVGHNFFLIWFFFISPSIIISTAISTNFIISTLRFKNTHGKDNYSNIFYINSRIIYSSQIN